MEVGDPWSARLLSTVLLRERQVLERLTGRLKVAWHLIEAGRASWIGPTAREVDVLLDRLGMLELTRAIEVADAAGQLGLVEPVTLLELAGAWPVPGRVVLHRHAPRLQRLVQDVCGLGQAVVDGLEQEDEHVDDEGSLDHLVRGGALLVVRRAPPPSLSDFVLGQFTARSG